jgi:hypothetical protein
MAVLVQLLIWAHFVGLAMGLGGGIAMSQVGPRLVAAAPEQRATWWPLATGFSRIASLGLLLLLVTGPLILWLKFGGMGGLNLWFTVKLALVAAAIVTIGLSQVGMARLRRGKEGGARLMMTAGPLTGIVVLAVTLAAVLAFD